MKIAVSIESKQGLESPIAGHFGKCPHFALLDVEDGKIQAVTEIDNPFFQGHKPGQVPTFIHEQDVQVMLAGGMGAKAIQFFDQFGIEGVSGAQGTVRDAVQAYLDGTLRGAGACTHSQEHHH